MNEFYTQIETQVSKEGIKSAIPLIFDNKAQAEAKHFAVLSAAAVSDVPYHASCIIRSDGVLTEGRVYDRRGDAEAPVVE